MPAKRQTLDYKNVNLKTLLTKGARDWTHIGMIKSHILTIKLTSLRDNDRQLTSKDHYYGFINLHYATSYCKHKMALPAPNPCVWAGSLASQQLANYVYCCLFCI